MDIQQSRQSDEADLQRAYVHLAEAQRLSQTGSFTWDFDRGELLWSEELCRIFEFDPATTVTTDRVGQYVHPDDLPAFAAVLEGAAAGRDIDFPYRIITASGVLKYLHAVGHRIEHEAERPVIIGAVQDVTERRVAEEALSRARAELAHVARVATLSALTASIAHEVNQPLTSLVTNASTCLRMLAADPPNLELVQTTAQRSIRDANRASEVIARLRAMFVQKEGVFEAVDLNGAATEVLALSSAELQRARVDLRSDFAGDLPIIRGDRIQLQQVILNLVLNARDAMIAVDDRPRALVVATRFGEAGQVLVTVRDTGSGIAPDRLDRLFDTFFTTKSEGMGVGLSISQSIVQTHGGQLWAANNDDGPGASFSFSIPLAGAGIEEVHNG